MPELPEVETTRLGLDGYFTGEVLDTIEVRGSRTVRRGLYRNDITQVVAERRIVNIGRLGKFIIFHLGAMRRDISSDISVDLVVHLGMSGRFVIDPPFASKDPHVKLDIQIAQRRLVFYDPRTFGEVFVSLSAREGKRPSDLLHLGPDPICEPSEYRSSAKERLFSSSTAIKVRLLDQRVVCGLGNIYSDEVLFRAKVRPDRPCHTLTDVELDCVVEEIPRVLRSAISARGSSLRDMSYLDIEGRPGGFQREHLVYGRGGEPCVRCGYILQRARFAGRTATYCEGCQN